MRGNGKVLVALYSDGERLFFSIQNEVFVISDRHVRIEKDKGGLFGRRQVRIIDHDRIVFDALFKWSWLEMSTWPTEGDIFDDAQQTTASREEIFRVIFVRRTAMAGHSLRGKDFLEQQKRYIASRLAADE